MATDDEKVLLLRNGNEGDYETELQNLPTSELGRGILSNMRLSRWYLAHCCLLAILSTVLLLLLVFRDRTEPPSPWLVAFDGIIVFSLLAETSIDLVMLKRLFWTHLWHIIDFTITWLSLLGFIMLILEMTQTLKHSNDVIAVILVALRYALQAIRVVRFLVAAHSAHQAQTAMEACGDVSFPPTGKLHSLDNATG